MQTDHQSSLTEVRGVLQGPGNEPLSGLSVRLSSAKERKSYQAVTDARGRFELLGLRPGDDYMLPSE